MIDKLAKNECCGCNACGDICPNESISFNKDEEGFLYPHINYETCIQCNLCEKVCPIINIGDLKKNDFEKPKCYAAVHKNLHVRFDSTSGGAFSAFAKKAYQEKAFVGGAVWNEDWSVSQYISNNKKDIERLRSSKYIQSNAIGFYAKVKKLLKSGEKVVVCGTPCQMAALRSFLGKPYEKLLIIDLVCMYVNSPKIWDAYIKHLENKHHSKVIYIKDKNKEIGWRTLCTKIVFENGDVIYETKEKNAFRRCYMGMGIAARPSCHNCKFKGFPRIADITLADFWGVEKYLSKDYDNNLGTSMVLPNSEKGRAFYEEKVASQLLTEEIAFDSILGGNLGLLQSHKPNASIDRPTFYKELNYSDFGNLVDKYLSQKLQTKTKLKNIARFLKQAICASEGNWFTFFKTINYNLFNKHIDASIVNRHYLILHPHTLFRLGKGSKIKINGVFCIGRSNCTKDVLYSKIILRENASLIVGGNYTFSAGCDIQVFKNAVFEIKGGGDSNVNIEIVCAKSITFEPYVYLGRNVIIRDTNGDHYMSRQGYKTSKPVTIGTHAWICDRASIMSGVHVWPGGIVGASACVTFDVPAFSMVSGNPAQIVDEEVYWKA